MKRTLSIFFGMIIFLLFIDLFTKRWMETHLVIAEKVDVLAPWLTFELLHNSGASFGFLSGYTALLISLQLTGICLLIYFYLKANPKSFFIQLGFAMVISGAVGNFIDRITFGYVIDFISIRWYPAIFNIADMEIRGGFLLLLFLYCIKKFDFNF
jgi:signal peptidase II